MKISLSWLKEYIDLPFSSSHIAKLLTSAGLEVDGIEKLAQGFKNVVIGLITKVEKHPNAEKLCVAHVSDGTELYQVVCGASNCREGLKTAFAKIGALLKDESGKELSIKQSKIRGVESFGMLCAADELGIGDHQEGIMEFADHVAVGSDVSEMYGDSIFDISLTPNLAHCASVIGVARELAAVTGNPIRYPESYVTEGAPSTNTQVKVSILDPIKCPRYTCRIVTNVQVKPSPEWMQKRLIACGIRPINNLVDATNYVMMEMGHPLHAFDYDTLKDKHLIIRDAHADEALMTLDGKRRVLTSNDLLICEPTRPLAIAGVMGGGDSEVSEKTTTILLESAYFQPQTVRRTSKKLNLQSEASKRFERGTDPNGLLKALDRAAYFIQESSGGTVLKEAIDCKQHDFPEKVIPCRLSRANQLLGTHFGAGEVETIFQRLEMKSQWDGQDTFLVTVPTYRGDVQQEIDLIEEIARIYGYEYLERVQKPYRGSLLPNPDMFEFEREIRKRLIGEGLQEFITCDLIGPVDIELVNDHSFADDSRIKVLNPTSIDQSILRTTLLPGLLRVCKHNIDRQVHNVQGFEIGRIHFKNEEGKYKEQTVAGIVLTGDICPYQWDSKAREANFFDLKGMIENVLGELKVGPVEFRVDQLNTLHDGRQAGIFVGALEIGALGEIHPSILRRLDVTQRILFAELNLHDLIKVKNPEQKMKPISIFPSSERDWTVTISEETPLDAILKAIHFMDSMYLETVNLIDLYRSDKLGKELKNATLRFTYRDQQKTLSQETVDAEHARLTEGSLYIILENNNSKR